MKEIFLEARFFAQGVGGYKVIKNQESGIVGLCTVLGQTRLGVRNDPSGSCRVKIEEIILKISDKR